MTPEKTKVKNTNKINHFNFVVLATKSFDVN